MKFLLLAFLAAGIFSSAAFAETPAVREMNRYDHLSKLYEARERGYRKNEPIGIQPPVSAQQHRVQRDTLYGAMPQEWFTCKSTADCSVVSSSCGPSLGINIRHKAQAQTAICRTGNCSGACDASARQAFAARCEKGICVPDYGAKPPPQPDVHYKLGIVGLPEPRCDGKPCNGKAWVTHYEPEWTACHAAADCALVSTPCGLVTGANIRYKNEVLKENTAKEPHAATCNAARAHAVAACRNGHCVPDFGAR